MTPADIIKDFYARGIIEPSIVFAGEPDDLLMIELIAEAAAARWLEQYGCSVLRYHDHHAKVYHVILGSKQYPDEDQWFSGDSPLEALHAAVKVVLDKP